MLNKKFKFSTTDFSLIKKYKPKKVFTHIGVFCVHAALTSDQATSKFAIVPTKKIFKTAVSRNKHKRFFFNSVNLGLLKSSNPGSVVFYPNKLFTKEEIQKELTKIVL